MLMKNKKLPGAIYHETHMGMGTSTTKYDISLAR